MRHHLAAVLLAGMISACLGPRTDTSRYYTLPEASPGSAGAGGATAFASVGLGPVTLPPYLARPELATRLGPERIGYAGSDRWSAPLDELVPRALAEDLRASMPALSVVRWPWPLGTPPEVAVAVDFLRFEADAGGGATLQARWTVTPRDGKPRDGETRVREEGKPGDLAGSVAALGRALGALARDLSAAARTPASR
jgi:uncharacterized lipoprotein YmbA